MPRVIDFSKPNKSDWDEARLAEAPVYGENEIRSEEIKALSVAFNAPVSGFTPQFSTYGRTGPRGENVAKFEAAHKWLSENTTGPWNWTETWSNHGHSLQVYVYVERVPDQVAFAEVFQDIFDYRATEEHELGNLAVNRGALPVLTAKESFSKWTTEYCGFNFLPAEDIGERGVRIAFTHAGLEAEFAEKVGQHFTVAERDGQRVYEANLEGFAWHNSPDAWLSSNAAVSGVSGDKGPDGYKWSIDVRFEDVGEALLRDWGHAFERKEGTLTFQTKDYPSTPERKIPEDFLAYIRGDRDDFEAPHLPETVKALREEAAGAPSPR